MADENLTEFQTLLTDYKEKQAELNSDINRLIGELLDGSTSASDTFTDAESKLKTEFEESLRELEETRTAAEELVKAKYQNGMTELRERMLNLRPLTDDERDLPPTRRAAYSDRAALLMAKLSMLAYHGFEQHDVWREILQDKLSLGAMKLVGTFDSGAPTDTQGYVCMHEHFAVLVFRGTTGDLDWRTNRRARRVLLKDNKYGIEVHTGFLEAYQAAEARILELIKELPPQLPVYITGHSLGGALSVIASAAISLEDGSLRDRIAAVYTFGAPRVAKKGFDSLVKAPHYRVHNKSDLVPTVPPAWTGFRHSGDVRFIMTTDRAPDRFNPIRGAVYTIVRSLLMAPLRGRFDGLAAHEIEEYVWKLNQIAKVRNDLL